MRLKRESPDGVSQDGEEIQAGGCQGGGSDSEEEGHTNPLWAWQALPWPQEHDGMHEGIPWAQRPRGGVSGLRSHS